MPWNDGVDVPLDVRPDGIQILLRNSVRAIRESTCWRLDDSSVDKLTGAKNERMTDISREAEQFL